MSFTEFADSLKIKLDTNAESSPSQAKKDTVSVERVTLMGIWEHGRPHARTQEEMDTLQRKADAQGKTLYEVICQEDLQVSLETSSSK